MVQKKNAKQDKAPKKKVKAAGKAAAAPKKGRARAGGKAEESPAAAPSAETVNLALLPTVFGVEVNEHLLYEAVKQHRAGARRGTHMTKNRALVSGSGRKPWRQKGTGRARVGEIRTPLWRHGGTVFGPVPRDYSFKMPKKAMASALRSALSQRAKEGALRVVERFPIQQPKTKELKQLLAKLGVEGRTVLVDHEPTDSLVLSGRNIPGLTVRDLSHLTVYDVLDCKNLLLSREAVGKLEERLAP